jgi:hypothetical protein
MNSDQFAAFEFMCRERAAIAKREMEYKFAAELDVLAALIRARVIRARVEGEEAE